MAIDSQHPKYAEYQEDWVTMRDLYKGERAVKAKREVYLPPTQGMRLDGMKPKELGREAYDAYLLRAVFHDFVKDAVECFIGMLHQKPATIELPAVMEPMREKATAHGEPLSLLHRRINEEQLTTGRLGLLLDLPVQPDPAAPLPYVAMYIAESIINWDDGQEEEGQARLNLVVLDESGQKRTSTFEWIEVKKYRVLILGNPDQNEVRGTYQVGVFSDQDGSIAEFDPSKLTVPMLRGQSLDSIPFVFVNSKDIVSNPDEPPLLGLGRLSLAIYRGEADYRQNLFMQGQDTLVIIGGRSKSPDLTQEGDDDAVRTGAGTRIEVETGGDAKYIGVESAGLSEQRESLQNDIARAQAKAGALATATAKTAESGDALQTRLGAQTASLKQIALTGAAALQEILRKAAVWMGANPEDVKVTPNLDFADMTMSGKDLVDLMTARTLGAPLSKESIHAILVDRGLTKMDYTTEMDTIEEENAQAPSLGTGAGGDLPLPPRGQQQPPQNQPAGGGQ